MALALALVLSCTLQPVPIQPSTEQALLTRRQVHSLHRAVSRQHIDAKWIEIERRWSQLGSYVIATAFAAPVSTSPGVCRCKALLFDLNDNGWFVQETGQPVHYFIPTTGDDTSCASPLESSSRIELRGELPDSEIFAILAAIRDGRDQPGAIPLDRKGWIESISVQSPDIVYVAINSSPESGQGLALQNIGGKWIITTITSWVT